MIRPDRPANEDRRLAALRRYEVLDTLPEQAYDDLAAIAAGICGTPMATVSLVDADRQWFKARHGVDIAETPRDQAFCAHAILDPQHLTVVPDALQDPRFADNPLVRGGPSIRFYAGAPLLDPEGTAIGTLCVMDRQPRQLDAFQRRALAALARQVTAQLELRAALNALHKYVEDRAWYEQRLHDYQRLLEEQNAELMAQSRTDPLTGLANRRAFAAGLDQAVREASARASPLAVAVVDIDHFKRVNDRHGHPAGDRVLAAVARLLHQASGPRATVARHGGEEFVLVLPDTPLDAARRLCETIRTAARDAVPELPVTLSIGLTAWRPGDPPEALYTRADQALYLAKRRGRNRVVVGE